MKNKSTFIFERFHFIFNKTDISDFIEETKYKEISNFNGGDDDYLCIDSYNEEFIFCENGCSIFNEIYFIEYQQDYEVTLKDLKMTLIGF